MKSNLTFSKVMIIRLIHLIILILWEDSNDIKEEFKSIITSIHVRG